MVSIESKQVEPEDGVMEAVARGEVEAEADKPDHAPDYGSLVGFREVMVGKVVVGLIELSATYPNPAAITQNIAPLLDSPLPANKLCGAILLARAGMNEEADAALEDAKKVAGSATSPTDAETLPLALVVEEAIKIHQDNAEAPALPEHQQAQLRERLGWYGDLLVSTVHRDEAFESQLNGSLVNLAIGFGVFFFVAAAGGLGGIVWLIITIVRATSGKLALPIKQPSTLGADLILIFAGWFALQIGCSLLGNLVAARTERLSGGLGIVLQFGLMFLPLFALAIPVLRGGAWRDIRREIGICKGKGILREIAYGFVTYATAIPLLVGGVIMALILAVLTGGRLENASHPIQGAIAHGDAWDRFTLLILAAVVAPFIEEIVFRGVLYRHLRDISRKWGVFLSFVVSALFSSAIFAAIHPQGLLFVPILGALAVAFCLAREMRGSLIAPMVAHGINNGLIVGLTIVMTS